MFELPTDAEPVKVIEGDCLEVLPSLPDDSADAVVTDPPYPEVERSYGYWTESEWFALIDPVVAESRRLVHRKPNYEAAQSFRLDGSAVLILQPNSERAGRMRPW